MKTIIVLSTIMAAAFARPGLLYSAPHVATLTAPIAYAKLVPGAPIGLDGRVVDTPEVSYAKAEHAAAHINERITLANEATKSAEHVIGYSTPILASNVHPVAVATKLVPGAPLGLDGRVVDTPEVAYAKAEHAAAHINEKIGLAHEAARSAEYEVPVLVSSYSSPLVQKYLI